MVQDAKANEGRMRTLLRLAGATQPAAFYRPLAERAVPVMVAKDNRPLLEWAAATVLERRITDVLVHQIAAILVHLLENGTQVQLDTALTLLRQYTPIQTADADSSMEQESHLLNQVFLYSYVSAAQASIGKDLGARLADYNHRPATAALAVLDKVAHVLLPFEGVPSPTPRQMRARILADGLRHLIFECKEALLAPRATAHAPPAALRRRMAALAHTFNSIGAAAVSAADEVRNACTVDVVFLPMHLLT